MHRRSAAARVLKGSFVPPTPIQDLRDLTRYRVELRQSQNRVANRIQKLLEQAAWAASPKMLDLAAAWALAGAVAQVGIVGKKYLEDGARGFSLV